MPEFEKPESEETKEQGSVVTSDENPNLPQHHETFEEKNEIEWIPLKPPRYVFRRGDTSDVIEILEGEKAPAKYM